MANHGGSDDDPTRIYTSRATNVSDETTILPQNKGGLGAPGLGAAPQQRGTVIGGVAGSDFQAQVRGPGGRPAVTPAAAPPASGGSALGRPAVPPGAQGETVFIMAQPGAAAGERPFDPVVGWLVVTKGHGRGECKPVFHGQNSIGRGHDQRIALDFGDQRISRDAHAYLIYDDEGRKFYLRDNGKSNVVRHNGAIVMMPTEIKDRDEISIGDTTVLFVALCNDSFDWRVKDEPAKA